MPARVMPGQTAPCSESETLGRLAEFFRRRRSHDRPPWGGWAFVSGGLVLGGRPMIGRPNEPSQGQQQRDPQGPPRHGSSLSVVFGASTTRSTQTLSHQRNGRGFCGPPPRTIFADSSSNLELSGFLVGEAQSGICAGLHRAGRGPTHAPPSASSGRRPEGRRPENHRGRLATS